GLTASALLSTLVVCVFFFFSSRRRHTRSDRDWSSDVCSSDLPRFLRLLALSATAGNLKNLGQIKTQQDAKAGRIKSTAESLRDQIEALAYEVRRQASEEGKLFGSVTSQDIVEFLEQHTIKVERRRVGLDEPIKTLGET